MSPTARIYVGARHHIHVFDLDVEHVTPTLVHRSATEAVAQPTYLVMNPSAPVLYAVNEIDDGEIVSFHVGAGDGHLTEWQRAPSAGDGPCHLDTDGEHLHVANYRSGSACGYALDSGGGIGEMVWSARHAGSGPHPRQAAPHAHCAVVDPRRPSVHVVDLGTDRVVRYDRDPATGRFEVGGGLQLPSGSGPRHLTFDPTGRLAYVVCELDNTVVSVAVGTDGSLVAHETWSTLSDDPIEVDGAPVGSLAAAIRVHPAGDRLYVSNRGHDDVAVFAIHDHRLIPLGHVATGGEGPRDIVIDPSGTVLLVANQRSGHITAYALDDRRGLPRPMGVLTELPEPTCVLAVEVTS